jgi:Patatin-like phospholipase
LEARLPRSLLALKAILETKEHREILARRKALGIPLADAPLRNSAALALSGGGIRSATFCLGIVQSLAEKNLFHQFDYLSTVSGGGYLGTFLSSVLVEESDSTDNPSIGEGNNQVRKPKEIIDEVFTTPRGGDSKSVRHLRNNSKYLGAGGIPWMAGLMAFGIFINILLLLPAPLFLALISYEFEQWGFWNVPVEAADLYFGLEPSLWGQCLQFTLVLLLGSAFILPFVQTATHGRHAGIWAYLRSAWEVLTLGLSIASLVFGLVYFLPEIFNVYKNFKTEVANAWPMIIAGALPFLLAYGTRLLKAWKRTQKFVLGLFILSGPVFFAVVFLEAGILLGFGGLAPAYEPAWLLSVALLLLFWGWFLVNINTLSPHRYYRNRLCECYLLRRNNGEIESRTDLPLTALGKGRAAPHHLINTTVNLTTSPNPELRGRNGDFFVLSRFYCGSALTGYFPTADVTETVPHVDLGTGMAISGAAASTGMGWQTIANFRFLMGVMNVRLGYWLRNPNRKIRVRLLEGPGPWYLYKEIFGWMKETDRYLNLSDGGHIENLAVYELLRRRCKFIVCVDGGHEPGMECADLIRLQRYAEIDLGIRMEYDISDLQTNEYGFSRASAILVKIIYAKPNKNANGENDWAGAELGWMLYLKLAMTGAEPAYVTDYRRTNPAFPHQTTADQFFDEAQFEAYRMLGECAAKSLFRSELTGRSDPATLEDWFQALANNLLPDNDPVITTEKSDTSRT